MLNTVSYSFYTYLIPTCSVFNGRATTGECGICPNIFNLPSVMNVILFSTSI